MKDMDLKMPNTTTSSKVEDYWSEHLLSKFGLEYIKHDVLFNESMSKEDIDILKDRATQNLAQVLQIEANEKNITEMCNKFRKEIFFSLRQVVRRCTLIGWDMKNCWQLEFARLLLPPWLHDVETKLNMLPQAVTEELRENQTMESVLKTKFFSQLREAAAVGFARGTFEANDFKKTSIYYNISMTETFNIWGDMCSQARRRILQEAQCKEGIREVDSELTELLLLYDHTFSIVTLESLSHQKQIQYLTHLCQIVLIKDVENVLRNDRPRLLEVWIQALTTYLMSYPFSLGFSSTVYVQRMWYELKQLARRQLLVFHLGHDQQPPNPLLLSIVAKHIVEEPMPTWSDYVKSKMVVKLKDISRTLANNILVSMNELHEARKQAEKKISSLNKSKQVCIVPPLNNEQTNKITENASEAIDNNSTSTKSDLNINDTKKDNQTIDKNEFVANTDNLLTLKNTMELNTVLNNIDPTKAQKCVILDSDSDSDTVCIQTDIHLNINKDICETKCGSEISTKSQETHGKMIKENPPFKLKNQADFKLIKNLTIPLIRCDIHPSKKYTNKNNESLKNKKSLRSQREHRSSSNNSNYYNKNITLNGLSEKFLRNDKNKCLFKLCKPISVKLERMKDERICRRAKRVKLADIEEVRKINSTILTAEVAPVSINRCDSPAEASSVGIHNEDSIPEISNSNIINSFELDDIFNKLPPPPLKPINVDKLLDKGNICSTYNCVIDSEQSKTNKSYFIDQKCHDDLNEKVLNIIRNRTAGLQQKLPTTVKDSSEDDIKLSTVANEIKDKNKKRQNEEIKQKQIKKRKKKSKRKNSESNEIISNNPLEEWHRQKNLNKKYFQLPNIAPKPVGIEKSKTSNETNKISKTNINQSTNPVIDLTELSDDTLENSVNTPIITNVFSLADTDKQNKNPQSVISPILLQDRNNLDLATLTKVQTNSQNLTTNLPQMNKISVSLAGKKIVVQKSAGRRFVIIPQSELMNENTPLLLSNAKIVNASVTANPVDHIQRMIVPNGTPVDIETPHQLQLMPWVPLDLWVRGKSDNELVILQINSSKPTWRMNGGQTIVTLTDKACDTPLYCSLPAQVKTRIIFPEENNGTSVYNPPTLQIYEESANGNTPFSKWVKSVVNSKKINDTTYINDTKMTYTSSRIKVKSFAKMTKVSDNFVAPSRVCLQDRLYMKVSEQPLKYAKVITALSSLDEFHNLVLEDAPLKLLPKDMIYFNSLQSLNNLKNSFIWPLSRHLK